MRFLQRKRRQPPAIIIVSLIDILIVLLIFLMVSTTFKRQPSMKLALPESKQVSKGGGKDDPIVVTLASKEPFLYLGSKPVTIERLEQELTIQAAKNPQSALSVRADTGAPVGQVVKIMDAAKNAKIKSVNLMTQPAAK